MSEILCARVFHGDETDDDYSRCWKMCRAGLDIKNATAADNNRKKEMTKSKDSEQKLELFIER